MGSQLNADKRKLYANQIEHWAMTANQKPFSKDLFESISEWTRLMKMNSLILWMLKCNNLNIQSTKVWWYDTR